MISESVKIGPSDKRCKHWAKIVRKGNELPVPDRVSGANDVPGDYIKNGDEELFEGDFMIEGEQAHHNKARGWVYMLVYIEPTTKQLKRVRPSSAIKAAIKAQGLPVGLLPGSGDLAAVVRIAHGVNKGLTP